MQIKIVHKPGRDHQPDRYIEITPMPLICNDTTELAHAKAQARELAVIWRNHYKIYLVTFNGVVLAGFEYFEYSEV